MLNIYEYFDKLQFTDIDILYDVIMNSEIAMIEIIAETLHLSTELDSKDLENDNNSLFSFTSSELMLNDKLSCQEHQCRIENAYQFSLFNTLYSDITLIPNIFDWLYKYDFSKVKRGSEQEFNVRKKIVGDILVMLKLRPLLERGILVIEPTIHHYCSEHKQLRDKIDKLFNKLFDNIKDRIHEIALQHLKVIINEPKCIEIKGDQEYLKEAVSFHFVDLPKDSIINDIKKFPYVLTKEEIIKEEIILGLLMSPMERSIRYMRINPDIKVRTAYLTSSKLETDMINELKNETNDEFYSNLFEGITHSLPILSDIDINSTINIREQNKESFNNYRFSIKKLLKQIPPKGSKKEIIEATQEIVIPEINKLDLIFKNYTEDKKKNTTLSLLRMGIGHIGSLFGFDLGTLNILNDGYNISSIMKQIKENIPKEIRNSDLFFLWQVQRGNK